MTNNNAAHPSIPSESNPSLSVSAPPLSLNIAGYDLCSIPTGHFGLDGGAMFGTVPKILWEKLNPPDKNNRILMEARALLLKGPKNILIDCGNGSDFVDKYGEKLGEKFQEIYNISQNPSQPNLFTSLEKYHLSPDDIDIVILTHLHFDHAGGGTRSHDHKLIPTFPNAQYYLQKDNLITAQNPNRREKASYFPANYLPLIEQNVLNIIDGEKINLFPGISLFPTYGHTSGQQVVKITDEQNTLLYCADLIPTSSHIRIAWLMGYDLDPLKLMDEKEYFLNLAEKNGWYLFFEHDPYCDLSKVTKTKQGDFMPLAQRNLI